MKRNKLNNKVRESTGDRIMNAIVYVVMTVFCIIILYPLIFVLSSSFSSGQAVSAGRVLLLPVEFSLDGYKIVFQYKDVWVGYGNTLFYTVIGTVLNLFITVLAAYPLARRNLRGRRYITIFFMVTMFFSGGLVPGYLLMSELGLVNTRWAILLSGTLSVYNMVIMRTFFENSVPYELLEAAKIDGISDIGYLTRILLPLSKPVLAVITLYYAVGHWNSYFTSLIYLQDKELKPLQIILRNILTSAQLDATQLGDTEAYAELLGAVDVMKYALVVVATVPILVIYPFVQKYFEKGVMVGSVKG